MTATQSKALFWPLPLAPDPGGCRRGGAAGRRTPLALFQSMPRARRTAFSRWTSLWTKEAPWFSSLTPSTRTTLPWPSTPQVFTGGLKAPHRGQKSSLSKS